GRKKPLAQRIDELEEATRSGRELILVGSSYGGLAALVLAHRHPERFHGLVLCAPALILREPPAEDPESLVVSPDLPCIVLHGIHDEIVPIDASRRLAERSPHIEFHELDDDHQLTASLPQLIEAVSQMRRSLPSR
ncbi:MAG: alpha/beta fold hydrolase, partial [Proteobacteria bacterium]|nr:alpha/beta fold hydrolase [Pseudomonadota bacterium]